jgi:hypothetical protein
MDIPLVAPLRQNITQPVLADVAGEARRQWRESRLQEHVRRGDRVAVAIRRVGRGRTASLPG